MLSELQISGVFLRLNANSVRMKRVVWMGAKAAFKSNPDTSRSYDLCVAQFVKFCSMSQREAKPHGVDEKEEVFFSGREPQYGGA